LGVNYWPARTAMGFWRSFDPAEVHDDFARIAASGFDSLRIFLTWEDFQPEPDRVDQTCLARLIATLDAAHEQGLLVMPTLFTGHMSGVNWLPRWALGRDTGDDRFRVFSGGRLVDSRLASWYSDPAVGQAQCLLAGQLASALSGHSALWAWDLGNENSNCGPAPNKASARDWLAGITNAIRRADEKATITIGLHMEDLEHDRNLGPAEAAEFCDFQTMHGYPGYAPFAAGPTDERLLSFLTRLTARLSGDAEVLFSEFGVPTAPDASALTNDSGPARVTEEAAAAYVTRALEALHACGSTGAMLWCYADYEEALWCAPPLDLAIHERSFGLWRADATPKPSVLAARSFADRRATLPLAHPIEHSAWFDLEVEQFYLAPERELPRLFDRYCAALAAFR
jgi:endo-1,4-beta-mannosidase